jgi:hypothetical protein
MFDYSDRSLSSASFNQFQMRHHRGETQLSIGFEVQITDQKGEPNGPSAVLWMGMTIDPSLSVQDAERAAVERGLALLKRLSQETVETLTELLVKPLEFDPSDN